MNFTPGERLGGGRVADVFAFGPEHVIKLLKEPGEAPWLEHELLAQRAAFEAGIRVPEPSETTVFEGRHGIVMRRVDGQDLLSAVEKQPWRLWSAGRTIGKLHRTLGVVAAPPGLPSLNDSIRRDIERSDRVPEAARGRVFALLESLPQGDRLYHGDFHPGNVMEVSGEPVVIDVSGARTGDPLADHANSLMLFEAGSPAHFGPWQRALVAFGRRTMRQAYRSGYGEAGAIDETLLRRWQPVVIARRLTEDIADERPRLLRLLSRTLPEAERG